MKEYAKITLGETEYKLRFTAGVLIDIEEELGMPISRLDKNMSFTQTAIFIKNAIMKEDGSKVTNEEWKTMVYDLDVSEMFSALDSSLAEIQGKKVEQEPGGDEEPKNQ